MKFHEPKFGQWIYYKILNKDLTKKINIFSILMLKNNYLSRVEINSVSESSIWKEKQHSLSGCSLPRGGVIGRTDRELAGLGVRRQRAPRRLGARLRWNRAFGKRMGILFPFARSALDREYIVCLLAQSNQIFIRRKNRDSGQRMWFKGRLSSFSNLIFQTISF